MPIERLHAGPRMSQVVIHNDTVYLAGQVASGAPGKSVAEQTKDILSRIDALLSEAGTDKSHLITATIGKCRETFQRLLRAGLMRRRVHFTEAKFHRARV